MIYKWWRHYTQLQWERKILWTAAGISLIPIVAAFLWQSSAPTPAQAGSTDEAASIDTFIPKGHVLIPIDVINNEALDSIVGRFAMVDLFHGEGPTQRPVARNVRLLRAPQNPSHFAILVPDRDADSVMKFGGSFTVIVKRMGGAGTEFVKGKTKTKRKVVYDGGA